VNCLGKELKKERNHQNLIDLMTELIVIYAVKNYKEPVKKE